MTADPVHGEAAERWGGWTWRTPRHGEHFRRCSYCGSIHPTDLVAEPTWHAEWADRKYGWPHKFYVNVPNRDPGAVFCRGSSYGPEPQHGMIAERDLTDEQRAIVVRDGMGREGEWADFYLFGTRDSHFGKFYAVHLADPAIPSDVKEAIFRLSGFRFTFADGHVHWHTYVDEESNT